MEISNGNLIAFDWTQEKFAWPRRVKGVAVEGNLRRWNPITRKNFLMNCFTGWLEWYMFKLPKSTEKMLPADFEELLDKPDNFDAAQLNSRVFVVDRPAPPKTEMVLSTGNDSGSV